MYYCVYYWLIAPIRGGIQDDAQKIPALSLIAHSLDGEEYELAIFCDAQNEPQYIRCLIPSLAAQSIPDETLALLNSFGEHMLTSLRLIYRMDLVLALPSSTWAFFRQGKPHEVNLSIEQLGENPFNPQQVKRMFCASYEFRELLRLYLDGADPRVPLQYRFLS